MRYFFVCGAPKSGTTWLQRLLDAHPALVCSGEGHFIEMLANPILQVIERYNTHMQKVADRVYEGRPYYQLFDSRVSAHLVRSFVTAVMSRRSSAGIEAVGDKTPRYTEFLAELRFFFLDARFLHIMRDPRDVAVSRLHHALRVGHSDALVSGSPIQIQLVDNAAHAWLRAQERFSVFASRYPEQCLQLKYEDLLTSPLEVLAEAFCFLGVSDEQKIVASCVDDASFEKWAGRARGVEDKSSFFRKGIAGDWRLSLDKPALNRIDAICGELLEQKGYR